jgi:hypothetical protein
MLPEVTSEEFAAALDRVVGDLLQAAAIVGPPIDALAVARALQITVAVDDRQTGRARYVRLSGRLGAPSRSPEKPSILVRSDPRAERRQWAVAHELGEHTAVRVFAQLAVDPRVAPPGSREMIANQLANRLLLPSAWVQADGAAAAWDLRRLKGRYATASHELIARRTLDFGSTAIVTICDQGRVTFRRGSQTGRVPPVSSLERECWQEAHSANRFCRRVYNKTAVRAWPIHEAEWKREILRTEGIDADDADEGFLDDAL